jgi:hypothetical protein
MGGERRGEKEFRPTEGCWDVVRETFRAHVSNVRKIGVHRIVWLLSVTRHEDSAWYHHLLVILWHLNRKRCSGDKAADRAVFEPICQALSKRLADLFESQQTPLKRAMEKLA